MNESDLLTVDFFLTMVTSRKQGQQGQRARLVLVNIQDAIENDRLYWIYPIRLVI